LSQHFALLLSFALAAAAVLARRDSRPFERLVSPLLVLLLGAETVLYLAADWFTGQGVNDAVIYHLEYGLAGAGTDDYRPLIMGVVVGLALSVVAAVLTARWLRRRSGTRLTPALLSVAVLLCALLIHPAATGFLASSVSPLRPFFAPERSDFDKYYQEPAILSEPATPRNLVMVFMESYERSWFNESVFPGVVKELKALESQGISFTNIEQLPGTGWTIGGLTASLCGLPLFTPSQGNSMSGMERFLPGATCIGDLLAERGWSLTYLTGSSAEFAGTGKLFNSHGFQHVLGLEQLRDQVPQDDPQGWGITDDELFGLAYDRFEQSSRNDKPFGLFISTIDTHPPTGRESAPCRGSKEPARQNAMLDAIACTDRVVSRFVRRIQESNYGDQTVVVLVSDHLAMPNEASDLLAQTDRKNLFLILDPGKPARRVTRPGSPLDIGPTVLAALGFRSKLALGRNLLGSEPSVSERVPNLVSEIAGWYDPIVSFWDFPRLFDDDTILIDPESQTIVVSDSTLKYPLLMQIEPDGETSVQFDSKEEGFRLTDFMARMEAGKAFVWVDHCHAMKALLATPQADTCLVYGQSAARQLGVRAIEAPVSLTLDDIARASPVALEHRAASEIRNEALDTSRIIAHAGGAVEGVNYTDSLEALDASYGKGFRMFELDILETSDGHVVAAHDWPFWQKLSGFEGPLPPTREQFLATPILGHLTPLDMDRINHWFREHPDAVLVTDKFDDPAAFAARFVDRGRLMMELFSLDSVKAGIDAGIRSAMPSQNVLMAMQGDVAGQLTGMGVNAVAISRRMINTQGGLLHSLRAAGIRSYVFHVNRFPSRDERYAVCSDLDFVYGFYADSYDFADPPDCTGTK
jgi:phosphoglycerol transferase